MVSAHFQFRCVVTNSKGLYDAKWSNSLLLFGAWGVPMEDGISEMSSEEFRKEWQSENVVHTAVMWD